MKKINNIECCENSCCCCIENDYVTKNKEYKNYTELLDCIIIQAPYLIFFLVAAGLLMILINYIIN